MLYRHEGTNKVKKFVNRGVYTVVLAERDGRMRVIQESGSTVREPIQRGSASWPSPAHFEKVRD
jgi:hypothetical protein